MAATHLSLTSPSIREGARISPRYTCEGEDRSPELRWAHAPEETRSFALIMDDPDAPGRTFTHWVLFDIPTSVDGLSEGEAASIGRAGKNDFQGDGYGGPCPPPNDGEHRYYFRLFALDVETLDVPAGARREDVERAMEGHVIGQTELMARFSR